jgi:hypothetical protein
VDEGDWEQHQSDIHSKNVNGSYLIKPSVYSTLTGISLPSAPLVFAMLNAHSVVAMDNQSWSGREYQLCIVREVKKRCAYGCARHMAAWTHPTRRELRCKAYTRW